MSRGLRNNNPGNIRYMKKTGWQGKVADKDKKDKAFEEFTSMAYGYRALIKLLQNYRRDHNCRTIADFIRRWAPPEDNNHTENYIARVCRDMMTGRDTVPNVNDKHTMCAFAAAISAVENGVPAVMSDVVAGWELLK